MKSIFLYIISLIILVLLIGFIFNRSLTVGSNLIVKNIESNNIKEAEDVSASFKTIRHCFESMIY